MNKDDFPVLPDESSFFTASMPLPKDHWLYAPSSGWDSERDDYKELPLPILTRELENHVRMAIRYAIRAATMNGTKPDFDPDALVQSAIYALCGPTSPSIQEAENDEPQIDEILNESLVEMLNEKSEEIERLIEQLKAERDGRDKFANFGECLAKAAEQLVKKRS